MNLAGPDDPAFVVPNATLLANTGRHFNLPYTYRLNYRHPLLNDNDAITQTYVYVQDTAEPVRRKQRAFEDTLRVPLGRDKEMERLGT
ncbi:hypothetical protein BDN72DRAFT_780095 [Pluteus cervinus]|uniref:Uncharacterized protein n=1 Tax=Pluteus cervinus TaxID=181527 RepID=A0ACD3A2J3_9AGAR|nr:hypothetical protein BDN72DRAFT_780095 [Pluteus cervinus]